MLAHPHVNHAWSTVLAALLLSTIALLVADSVQLSRVLHHDGSWNVTPACASTASYLSFHLFTAVVSFFGACIFINARGAQEALHELVTSSFLPEFHGACATIGAFVVAATLTLQFAYAVFAAGALTVGAASACSESMYSLWSLSLADAIVTLATLLLPMVSWVPAVYCNLWAFARVQFCGSHNTDASSVTAADLFCRWSLFIRLVFATQAAALIADIAVYSYADSIGGCAVMSSMTLAHIILVTGSCVGVLLFAQQSSQVTQASTLDIAPMSVASTPLAGSIILGVHFTLSC